MSGLFRLNGNLSPKHTVLWIHLPILLVCGLAFALLPGSSVSDASSEEVRFDSNLISNPGFESGSESWQLQPGGAVSVTDLQAHKGRSCLRVTNDGGGMSRYAYNSFVIEPGLAPQISVWVRTDNLQGKDKTGAYISIQYFNRSGAKLGIPYTTRGFTGTHDWTLLSATATPAPEGSVKARFGVHLTAECTGTAYYDDASASLAGKPQLHAVLGKPDGAGLSSGGGHKISVAVRIKRGRGDSSERTFTVGAEITREGSDASERASLPAVQAGRKYVLQMDVPAYAPGKYNIVLNLRSSATSDVIDSLEIPLEIEGSAGAPRCVSIDAQNRLIVNGRPFFPLGFYTWRGGNKNEIQWLNRFKSMGFNTVLHYSTLGKARKPLQAYMDEADKIGMKVILSVKDFLEDSGERQYEDAPPGFGSLKQVVNEFKDSPALLVWYINDEMSDWYIPQLKARYDWIKAADPQHPMYQVLYAGQPFEKHLSSTDIIGSDKYPNFGNSREAYLESPIWSVSTLTESVQQAVLGSRPVWMVVSSSSKQNARTFRPRPPTYEEVLCMSYQAVIHGSRGLFFFCAPWMNDDGEDQWQVMTRAGKHLSSIENIFLGTDVADAEQVTSSSDKVSVITRHSDGNVFVLAVNPFEDTIDCTFKLPSGNKVESVMVETPGEAGKKIDASRGSFRDRIEMNGVRVYRLVGD